MPSIYYPSESKTKLRHQSTLKKEKNSKKFFKEKIIFLGNVPIAKRDSIIKIVFT